MRPRQHPKAMEKAGVVCRMNLTPLVVAYMDAASHKPKKKGISRLLFPSSFFLKATRTMPTSARANRKLPFSWLITWENETTFNSATVVLMFGQKVVTATAFKRINCKGPRTKRTN